MTAVRHVGRCSSDRAEQVEHLRRKIAEVSAKASANVGSTHRGIMPSPASLPSSENLLQIPESLTEILPDSLPKGSVAVVSGARSLPLRLVAAVTAAGGHAAIVGHPEAGLLAAVEMGADLSRLAVIPDPGADPVEVAAVLMDGLDLVVLGLGGRSVAPTRARAVTARARQKGCTLVVTDGDWHGASARLESKVCGFDVTGAGPDAPTPGCGRISRVRVTTRASGRFVGHARAAGG